MSEFLDGAIALVLVVLLLSLIVQTAQEFLKRFTRLKARRLEEALGILFAKAGFAKPEDLCATLITDVATSLGRKSLLQERSTAEQISKEELLRWLDEQRITASLETLKAAIANVEDLLNQPPGGALAAPFASLQAQIRPFLASLPADGDEFTFQQVASQKLISMEPVMRDVTALRELPGAPAEIDRLPEALTAVLRAWQDLEAPARRLRRRVENWFDTVMLGLEERYRREMRVWSLLLGFLVAIAFNANFFVLAHDAFGSAARRAVILQNQPAMEKLLREDCSSAGTEPEVLTCLERKIEKSQELAATVGLKLVSARQIGATLANLTEIGGWARLFEQAIGILLTGLLIAAGAPFWQDVLQSLMGLKKSLRRTDAADGSALGRLT